MGLEFLTRSSGGIRTQSSQKTFYTDLAILPWGVTPNYKRWMSRQISLSKLGLKKQCWVVPRGGHVPTHTQRRRNRRLAVPCVMAVRTRNQKALLDLRALRPRRGEGPGKRGWRTQKGCPGGGLSWGSVACSGNETWMWRKNEVSQEIVP